MLLAIDAGNTNIVFAVFKGGQTVAVWRSATDAKKTADDFAVWLKSLFDNAHIGFADITGCIVSSVVPDLDYSLKQLAERHFKHAPVFVEYGKIKLNFDVVLASPAQLGADRIVNAAAVNALYKGEAEHIIIDFGTATTFDVLDRSGNYIGGVIAPGPALSLQALYNAAAKLPPIDLEPPAFAMGTDTVSAMQSGVYFGYAGLIEGLIARLEQERGHSMHIIATGGLAALFKQTIKKIDIFDADLTLKGLQILYEMNKHD